MTDLYAELGVPRAPPPTPSQIRAAYRRRAKRALERLMLHQMVPVAVGVVDFGED